MGGGFTRCGTTATRVFSNFSLIYAMTNVIYAASGLITVIGTQPAFQVLLRENINSWYSVSAWYWTRTLIESAFGFFFSLFYSGILWFLSSQVQDPAVSYPLVLTLVGLQAAATHCLIFILCLYTDEATNHQLPYIFSTMQMLFGGYTVITDSVPVSFLS